MDVRILGLLEVWEGSEQLVVDSPRQRSILALLAINANEVVSVDRIVDELWGESPPESAQSTVRYHVSKLRSALGDAATHVVTRSPGYVLEVPPESIDVHRFEAMAAEGRSLVGAEPDRAARVLVDALAMWRGSPLTDFTYDPFARGEITRLEELRLAVLEDRIEADLASGRRVDLVGELEGVVGEHPLRERLWGQLMTALYRTGRQAEALRAYQQARDALGEIGIEPSEELRAVEEQVLLQDPVLLADPGPVRHHNLPERLSSFVGRVAEIDDVRKLLGTHRVVTLTGVGGVGKTSLAVEAARADIDAYPDGIWFIDTSAVGDPELIAERLAHVLGIRTLRRGGLVEQVCDHLRRRRTLLVFDSCERHIDTVAPLVESLATAAADVRILATSREPLGIGGEARFGVPVLGTEGTEADAIRLFRERASLIQPAFEAGDEYGAIVTRVCRRLAGIPLGIELAAARLSALTLGQIDERLDDQMSLLTRGRRRPDSHHDSLELALDWSHDLLSPAEQLLFRRLSVFEGGFTFEAAREVCADESLTKDAVENAVTRLVDVSLVSPRAGARFALLDPVAQYAAHRLEDGGEATAVRRRHAEFYRGLARLAYDGAYGPDDVEWSRVCAREEPNHIAAVAWALDRGEPALAVATAAHLTGFWSFTGRVATEERLLGPTLDAARKHPSIELVMLLSHAAYVQGSKHDALALIEEALGVAEGLDDELAIGLALQRKGGSIGWLEDMERGIQLTRRAIEVLDRIGRPEAVVGYLNLAGMLVRFADARSLEEAEEAAREVLTRGDAMGSVGWQAMGHQAMGWVALSRGDLDQARVYLSRAVPLHAAVGAERWVAVAKWCLADLELTAGNVASAIAYREECGELFDELWGNLLAGWDGLIQIASGRTKEGVATLLDALLTHAQGPESETVSLLCALGAAAIDLNEGVTACRIYAAAESMRARNRATFSAYASYRLEQDVPRLRRMLAADTFNQEWGAGAAMSIDDVAALVASDLSSITSS